MKGTTLGTLKVGQKFVFGGVLFKVKSFNGEGTVDCSIGSTRNTVVYYGLFLGVHLPEQVQGISGLAAAHKTSSR